MFKKKLVCKNKLTNMKLYVAMFLYFYGLYIGLKNYSTFPDVKHDQSPRVFGVIGARCE